MSWKGYLLGIISLFFFVLILILINTYLVFCLEGSKLKEKVCINSEGIESKTIGALETTTGKAILIILGILALITLIVVIISRLKKSEQFVEELREKKEITGDEAEKYISEYFLKKSNISYITTSKNNIIIPKNFIRFYRINKPFIKPDREYRVVKEFEVLQGNYSGVYTTIINLAKTKDWILNGDFFWENTTIDSLKIDENKYPIYQPKTQRDIMMERLERIGATDVLKKIQEQELEKVAAKVVTQQPIAMEQQSMQQMQQPSVQQSRRYIPRFKRRYY